MKVLLAEDDRISRTMLQRDLEKWGHEVVAVENGQQAWERYQTGEFAIVISDWMMPEMDGLELVRRIRDSNESRYVYLLLLTARNQKEDIIRGMEAGADDFLTKPYDRNELRVRLRAGERIIELERNLAERNRLLDAANQRMKRDLQAAATVQQSLLPNILPQMPGVKVAWRFRPCDELAGDFLNVFPLDDHNLGLYVADVSGHGVAASLLSVAISRLMTPEASLSSLLVRGNDAGQPGNHILPPAEVANELNRRFPMEKSGDRYFTLAYAILDVPQRQLSFISAGHPPLVYLSPRQEPRLLKVKGHAIGWFAETVYEQQSLQLQPGDRLFLYSDGLPEAMNASSEQFSFARITQLLQETYSVSLEDSIERLLKQVEDWCGSEGPRDDLSILGMEVN